MKVRFIRRGNIVRADCLQDNRISQYRRYGYSEPKNLVESSPTSTGTFENLMKSPSTSSPKKSKRALQKRVVSVIPIKEPEGSRLKGEGAPPSDSWAWRKYGQKPIKGSPYPRGYYRCSSSKGCPARKQVERSRDDPTKLVITYSCEHNHPWPSPRNSQHHHNHRINTDTPIKPEEDVISTPDPEPGQDQEPEPETDPDPAENKLGNVKEESTPLMSAAEDEFGWFTDMETTAYCYQRPFSHRKVVGPGDDVALLFPMREEDEPLFADLGELPECSVVFS